MFSKRQFLARHSLARTLLIAWFVAVCAVTIGSLLPPSLLRFIPGNTTITGNDKVTHFLAYFVLAVLPVAAIDFAFTGIALASIMVPLGVFIEFLQRMVPGRSFESGDMIADTLGVCVGISIALALRPALRALSPAAVDPANNG